MSIADLLSVLSFGRAASAPNTHSVRKNAKKRPVLRKNTRLFLTTKFHY